MVLHANPSAMNGYDESKTDLVDYVSGNATKINDSSGLLELYTYGTTTTATNTTAGDVVDQLKQTSVQRGETGTAVPQALNTYYAIDDTNFPVATTTQYRNDDGTGGQTTTYAYTWNGNRPASITTTLPTVTTGQNGSNSATSTTTVMDGYGRMLWIGCLAHSASRLVGGPLATGQGASLY